MYPIRKPRKERVNKSGAMRLKMLEVLPKLEVKDSFSIPLEDFNGKFDEFQKTVSAILCIYVRDVEPDKKFGTRLNKKSKEVDVTRLQ